MARKIISEIGDITAIRPPRYVYVASAKNHLGLKIGSTVNLQERLATLRQAHGVSSACGPRGCERLEGVDFQLAYEDAASLESLLHATFRPWRIHGEWFDVEPREVEVVADVLIEKL